MPPHRATPSMTAPLAFARFVRHLCRTEPQVPIHPELDRVVRGFVYRISNEQPLDTVTLGWEVVVKGMAAAVPVAADAPRCGLPVLLTFAQLGEALWQTQEVRVPPAIAIMMLMEHQPTPLLFDWTADDRVATTALGVTLLGGRASYVVPKLPCFAEAVPFFRAHLDHLVRGKRPPQG